jgi:competence protein ComEC
MGARGAIALAVALWCGLACGGGCGPAPALACALAGLLLAWLPLRERPLRAAWTLPLAFALLGAARGGAGAVRLASGLASVPAEPALVRLVAVVAEPPRREGDAPAAVLAVLAASPPLVRGVRVRVHLPAAATADWLDTVDVLARISRLPGPRNPGGFDARAAAGAACIVASGRAYTCRVRPARGLAALPVRAAMRVRRACEAALDHALSPAARELAVPLLFGDRDGMTPDTDSALRASGLVHLLALSGLHVAWLAGVARGVAALCGGGLLARALAGAASAVAYALVAGPIPSLARAVAAEAVTALARATHRAADPLQSLALAALLLLAWQPAWAGDLGFQLSCAATLGLVAIGGPLARAVGRDARVWQLLAPALATTLGAQLAALPLLLARFHALPWTALGANLVAVPVSELLLAAAGLGACAEALLSGSGSPWLAACEPLAWALHALTRTTGAWPGALLATGASRWPVVCAALGGGLLALALAPPRALDARMRPARRANLRSAALGSGVALSAFALWLALAERPLRPPPGTWWLVVLDVGQGDALAVAGADGWRLVDAGPRSPHWDAGEGAVLPFFRWAGVRALEALALTHDDGDHTGGANAVRRGLWVRSVVGPAPRPGVPGPCARFGAHPLARGDTLARSPLALVRWPPRPGEPGEEIARRGDNAASLVLEVGEGPARALLTADADSVVESALEVGARPAVLKAGHHGSGSSSGAGFTARLRPERAALSVGANNPYGHPNPAAIAHLLAGGARIERTDREGALWYEFSTAGVRRLDWRHGEPRRAALERGPAAGAATAARAP